MSRYRSFPYRVFGIGYHVQRNNCLQHSTRLGTLSCLHNILPPRPGPLHHHSRCMQSTGHCRTKCCFACLENPDPVTDPLLVSIQGTPECPRIGARLNQTISNSSYSAVSPTTSFRRARTASTLRGKRSQQHQAQCRSLRSSPTSLHGENIRVLGRTKTLLHGRNDSLES